MHKLARAAVMPAPSARLTIAKNAQQPAKPVLTRVTLWPNNAIGHYQPPALLTAPQALTGRAMFFRYLIT